jgi:tetratricopeptide (TPR) repeat protein
MDDVFARYREALEKGHQAVTRGKPREALVHYEEAASLAPARPTPHVCIAGVLLRTGRTDEALAAFDRALERAPDDASALSGKAAALDAAGRSEEAAEVTARLADSERRGRQQRRDARADATALEAERSGALSRPEILHFAGEQAWIAGRRDTALEQWLEAARAYADAGHPDAALESAQRALLAAPSSPRVHLEMSRLYIRRGWIDRAAERLVLIERLLELEPDPVLRTHVRDLAAAHASSHPGLAALAASSARKASPPAG